MVDGEVSDAPGVELATPDSVDPGVVEFGDVAMLDPEALFGALVAVVSLTWGTAVVTAALSADDAVDRVDVEPEPQLTVDRESKTVIPTATRPKVDRGPSVIMKSA